MKIGLALSGGGIRATVFHLGVLARLARQSRLEDITFMSTVSGGSLAIGLIWAISGSSWPSSQRYLEHCIPTARRLTTEKSVQRAYIWRSILFPWRLMYGRAAVLGSVIQDLWELRSKVSELPDLPRWIINATCYETGKNWRFMAKRMGDYLTGYVLSPTLPVADAVAASAAFPGLVGPLSIRASRHRWHGYDDAGQTVEQEPAFPRFHLWDGGVYDNLGTEALFKPGGYREGFDFLVVSDASSALEPGPSRLRAPLRLLHIATDQVRSLRARSVVAHLQENAGTGAYLRIGNTTQHIYEEAGVAPPANLSDTLAIEDGQGAAKMSTTLRQLSSNEFDLLYRHGYEVADATLSAYCPRSFAHLPIGNS